MYLRSNFKPIILYQPYACRVKSGTNTEIYKPCNIFSCSCPVGTYLNEYGYCISPNKHSLRVDRHPGELYYMYSPSGLDPVFDALHQVFLVGVCLCIDWMSSSSLIDRWCEESSGGQTAVSTGQYMFFRFYTDGSVVHQGFSITYRSTYDTSELSFQYSYVW